MIATEHEQEVIAPLEDRLSARLDLLKTNRATFITNAQRELAALDAAIAELSALLDPATLNGREDGADAGQA
jgi:hypothetical protein